MPGIDTNYYRNREKQEREAALHENSEDLAAIHIEVARQYRALVDDVPLRPRLQFKV